MSTPPPPPAKERQYHLTRDGANYGPYTSAELAEMLANGAVMESELVWFEGLQEWIQIASIKSDINKKVLSQETTPIQELRNDIDIIFKLNPSFRKALKGDMIDEITFQKIYDVFPNFSDPKEKILFSFLLPWSVLGLTFSNSFLFPMVGIIISENKIYVKGSTITSIKNIEIPIKSIQEFRLGVFSGGFIVNKKDLLNLEPNGAYNISKTDRIIIDSTLQAICRMNLKNK